MRRQIATSVLLYRTLYPTPGPSDPSSFSNHLARNLVPEIRVETARFYGSLDSIEARYPGLNYCYAPHRMRLSRFPHHARLFAAIDALRLTDHEVLDLVRWEGTLWARERFERDENVRVRDTTGDGIGQWVARQPGQGPRRRGRHAGLKMQDVDVAAGASVAVAAAVAAVAAAEAEAAALESADGLILTGIPASGSEDEMMSDGAAEADEDDDDIEDGPAHVGSAVHDLSSDLNRRLLAAVAARQRGQPIEMDPEFEQFLKEQAENGSLGSILLANVQSSLQSASMVSAQRGVAAASSASTGRLTQPAL